MKILSGYFNLFSGICNTWKFTGYIFDLNDYKRSAVGPKKLDWKPPVCIKLAACYNWRVRSMAKLCYLISTFDLCIVPTIILILIRSFLYIETLFVINTAAPAIVYALLAPLILIAFVGVQGMFICHKIVAMWVYVGFLILTCVTVLVFGVVSIVEEKTVATQLTNRTASDYSKFVSSLNLAAFTEAQLIEFFAGGVFILGVVGNFKILPKIFYLFLYFIEFL